jgi:hypothetical protein
MSIKGSTVFFVGPPAAGKSTIGRAVADVFDQTFRTIDDWTPRGVCMTDHKIELALRHLFSAAQPMNEIVEFCHHSYQALIDTNTYPLFTFAPKIVVTAPLPVCRARNQQRRSPVHDAYVERAWRSAEWLAQYEGLRDPLSALVVDTDRQSKEAAISAIISFISKEWR